MAETTATMNIYQKLAKIRKSVEIMKRDTKAFGYSYTKEESILAKITVYMDKYNLSLVPGIVPGTTTVTPYTYKKTKSTQKGDIYEETVNEVLVAADTTWTWINNDNPEERIVVPWSMVGQQSDASQSFGSGLTYSSRYFLLKYFNISTSNDDPDKFRSQQKEAEEEERRAIAEGIVQEIDRVVQAYLSVNPDKRDVVKTLAGKYIKGSNYTHIKDPILAGKMLEEAKTVLAAEPAPEEPEQKQEEKETEKEEKE